MALARVGDHARAESLVEELEKSNPLNTVLKVYWLPTIKAAIGLNKGHSAQSLVSLEPQPPTSSAGPLRCNREHFTQAYVRGQAYLAAQNGSAATTEFQKLLDHPGVVLNFPLGALAHFGLARAYSLSGDKAKARTTYQDSRPLERRRPRHPHTEGTKAEYAKLQ